MLLARLFFLALLACWTALLSTPLVEAPARSLAGPSLLEARSWIAAGLALARALAWAALVALRFAPLGTLAVLALPDHEGRLGRLALVALPAIPLALACAALALGVRAGSAPGPFELVLPGLGVLVGVGAGLAWRRGWGARLRFLPSLLAQAFVLLLLAAGFAVLALQPEPLVPETAPLRSAEKRQLVERFEGKNPRKVPPGETRTLRLTAGELDRLAGWAALSTGAHVRPALRLEPGGLSIAASVRIPRVSRWLNVEARARAGIERGRLTADAVALRIGRFRVPALVLDVLTPFVVAGLRGDRDLRRVLPAVEALAFSADAATLTYGRVDMPPGLVARLVWGEEAGAATRAAVYEGVDQLLATLRATPEGDARFARAMETTFALAARRSAASAAPAAENRVAILALGVVLGHPRLARSVGERLDDERAAAALELLSGTTLRGRHDWVRHFTVSASLTVLSAAAPSDAAGLLKEELDADGGSGFSFADLLADRAGTTLASAATRDDEQARLLQQRMAAGFDVEDYFPPAADLPEGIPEAELQARYGGVGGPRYRELVAEIERRLAQCEAYQRIGEGAQGPP